MGSNLEEFLKDIEKLKEAKELLDDVWNDIGPYQDGKVSPETWRQVRNFFKFDDSE